MNSSQKILYTYGMRLRGFAPGCQPLDGLADHCPDPTGKYHDILVYERELSRYEQQSYGLDYLGAEMRRDA